jgi:hypothetical protein
MTRDEILADLRRTYQGKALLSPADLAAAIGRSPKAQANMRSRGMFPMPVKRIGGRVGVTVYDLAEYLAGESPATPPPAQAADPADEETAPGGTVAMARPGNKSAPYKAEPAPWLPARRRRSLGPEIMGFRQALDFWGSVHAEMEAIEIADAIGASRGSPGPQKRHSSGL